MQMLKTAIQTLPMDVDAVIRNVTGLALEAVLAGQTTPRDKPKRLQQELSQLQQKKEAVMDAYFSKEITKEDMQAMKERYEQQLKSLQKRLEDALKRKENRLDLEFLRSEIQLEVMAILRGNTESEVFYKTLLRSLTVFRDRHMELCLNHLPQVYYFTE